MISTLSAAFALLATLLAAIGLYGVLAYTVSQRTREIGLRMAFGADGARVRANDPQTGRLDDARRRRRLVSSGRTISDRLRRALLFELKPYDPVVVGLSVALLTIVAFGAGYIPAYRASRVHPMQALRYE